MPNSIILVPECHVDTALARILISGNLKLVDHKHGIPKVATSMKGYHNTYGDSRIVVGFVDGDKKFDDIKLLAEFRQGSPYLSCIIDGCKFDIWRHPSRPTQYLVVLEKACDKWIFNTASVAQIDLSDHNLPSNFKSFLDITKKKGVENKIELINVLKSIRKANPEPYQLLSDFITTLKSQTY
jgi:hypothetical protein